MEANVKLITSVNLLLANVSPHQTPFNTVMFVLFHALDELQVIFHTHLDIFTDLHEPI